MKPLESQPVHRLLLTLIHLTLPKLVCDNKLGEVKFAGK